MDWKGAVQDIQGAADYLHSNGCTKVGVVGFCMGGALTLASSVLVNGVHAAAPFYGIPSKELADPKLAKTVKKYLFFEWKEISKFEFYFISIATTTSFR